MKYINFCTSTNIIMNGAEEAVECDHQFIMHNNITSTMSMMQYGIIVQAMV